ncbi:MAG: hypothetical protein LUD07_00190 [Clostridiales bacterium]|nr:hypothetical protein [Clostridiales bacterium]
MYNRWLVPGFLLGICLRGDAFFGPALSFFAVSYVLFRLRLAGGGDGKIAALLAGYLGVDAGLKAVGAGMLTGIVCSLYYYRQEKGFYIRLDLLAAWFWQMIHLRKITECGSLSVKNRENTIPLAACMAVGTYLYLFVSFVL